MKIVLGANVVVAAFASRGLCESIFELCLDSHEIILSDHLLDEIKTNLVKKIKLPQKVVSRIVQLLRDQARFYTPVPIDPENCRDTDDLRVLGLALVAEADFIVSGDKDLLILERFKSILSLAVCIWRVDVGIKSPVDFPGFLGIDFIGWTFSCDSYFLR